MLGQISKRALLRSSQLHTLSTYSYGAHSSFNSFKSQHLLRPMYLDMQATTPIDFRVLDKMLPFLTSEYGNPHSKGHVFGAESESAVEEARRNIAQLLNADRREIVFTSGATESNNAAILGICKACLKSGQSKNHLITTQIEHKTVLEAIEHAKNELGFDVTVIEVDEYGRVDLNHLKSVINEKTLLVSIMAMNNEIGVFQDLKAIGDICESKGVYFHTDAAQAIGKTDIDVKNMHIDFLSFTGHKSFAPKGTGGLFAKEIYIARDQKQSQNTSTSCSLKNSPEQPLEKKKSCSDGKTKNLKLEPILFGGGQERGLRSGTLSPPMVVAMGEACKIAKREMKNDSRHVKQLYERMVGRIQNEIPLIKINGHPEHRFYGNLNVSFKYLRSHELFAEISDKVAFSAGAACLDEPSYVLSALKVHKEYALGSVRIGVGRFTTQKEVDYLIDLLVPAIHKLRKDNPLFLQELARLSQKN